MAKRRAKSIKINEAWCKDCRICVAFCQPAVLLPGRGAPRVVNIEECTLCMLCELRCPDFAIEIVVDKAETESDSETSESETEEKEVAAAHAATAPDAG